MNAPTTIAGRLLEDDVDPKEFVMAQPVYYVIMVRGTDNKDYYYKENKDRSYSDWTTSQRRADRWADKDEAESVAQFLRLDSYEIKSDFRP